MKTQFSTLILFILFTIPFTLHSQEVSNELKQQIDDLFKEYEGKPGASIGVFKNGKVLYNQSYGLANLDYNIPVTNQTVFEIGLTSQQFTAACIVLLENQGKLSFDDPIQKYLPEIPTYASGTITIRQLLLHTSGLRDYIRLFFATGQAWNHRFGETDALKLMSRQNGLSFAPGERAAPGDSNFSLLASIVRRITGMSMGDFAKKEIFEPLGMKNSLIYEDISAIIKNRATGYTDEGNGYVMDHYYTFTGGGNRRVYTTTEDFFQWNEALRNNLLGDDTFMDKMLTKGTLNNGDSLSWGFALDHGIYRGHKLIGYGGPWAGFASMFLRFPEEDLSVVVLTNNGTINVYQKTYGLSALFLSPKTESSAGTASVTTGKSFKLSAKKQKAFTGTYFNYENGYSREIVFRNDSLIFVRPDGVENLLIPTGKNNFEIQSLGVVLKFTFTPTKSGSFNLSIDTNMEAPFQYVPYTTPDYSAQELRAFEGHYYSEDLDVTYVVKTEAGNLVVYIEEDEPFLTWQPTMRDVFHEDHFGYLAFEKDTSGKYTSFSMNNSLGRIEFVRQE